jgi:hypothetical protein
MWSKDMIPTHLAHMMEIPGKEVTTPHMADNKPTADEAIELEDLEELVEDDDSDEEVEEAPQGIRPNDLARELNVDGKRVRAYLRQEYPRPTDQKNTNWFLTDSQVAAVRARFTPTDEDEVEETDSEDAA